MRLDLRAAFLALATLLAFSVLTPSARADEGMWTFDNFPAAAVKAKYGATIDQAWLDHVRGAAVRLAGGCSASVVSGQGLVLTNHHCVADCVQSLSTPERDYVRLGYGTTAKVEERLCPGMQAEILMQMSDVTDRIAKASGDRNGPDLVRARDAEIAAIEKQGCAGRETTYRCQVISFYQGGRYQLYTYRKYTDVRLVFAPEFATAFFGGDPDNFNFPRYDADFSFLRLYDGGKPAATPDHLTWSPAAPRAGELVFVAGNPGTTERLLTADQLKSLRDFALPKTLIPYSELRGRYTRFGEENAEHERIVTHDLFSVENSLKAWRGQLEALADDAFIAAKARADAELKAKAAADPALKDIGDPWADLARIQTRRAALYDSYTLLESRAGWGSDLFYYARGLVRAAEERTRPDAQRLREYTDARLPLVQKNLLDVQPVEPELEQQKLEFWLTKVREYLTADAPATKAMLGKDSPETLAKRLAGSRLGESAVRKALWEGGEAAVQASDDPLIRFVRATDRLARDAREVYEARVSGPSERATQGIARARFAIYGTGAYPDATFSLRLSYGVIDGWTYQGVTVPPFTELGGLYERATGQPPFDLAPSWLAAKSRIDPRTVFDISTTNDIIGGNSGSPLIDGKGEVIGAIFDGNIHSLGGDYGYDAALNRAVAVSTAAITEALTKVYGQQALVRELMAN